MKGKTIAILILILGLTSILLYFIYEEKIIDLSFYNSSKINIEESGVVNLINLKNQTDEEGLKNSSKKLLITNISGKDIIIKLKLLPDKNNTLDILNIRYGIYMNDDLYNIKNFNNSYVIYEGLLHKDDKVNLEIFIWLDALYNGSNETFTGTFNIEYEEI